MVGTRSSLSPSPSSSRRSRRSGKSGSNSSNKTVVSDKKKSKSVNNNKSGNTTTISDKDKDKSHSGNKSLEEDLKKADMSSQAEGSPEGEVENKGDDNESHEDSDLVHVQLESPPPPPECIDLASDDSSHPRRSDNNNTEDEDPGIGEGEKSQGDVDMEKPAPLEKSILEELEKESVKVEKVTKGRRSSKKKEPLEPEPRELPPDESEVSVDPLDLADLLGKSSTKKRKLPTSRAVPSVSALKTPKLEPVAAAPTPAVTKSAEKPKTEAPNVMLKAGKEKRPTCSSYLSYHSAQFKNLLPKGRKTSNLHHLEIKLEDPSILGLLVKKIKDTSPTVTFEEAKKLLQPAVQFEMNILKESCTHAIMENVKAENWLDLKFFAIEASSTDLNRSLDRALESEFKSYKMTMLKSKQFLEMPMQQLGKLLQKKNLNVAPMIVHELVEGWLSHDKRLQNQSVFAQIKTFELLRSDEHYSNSIFDQKPGLELPMLDIDTPGWVFLQSMVTPKQLTKSFKSLEVSLNRVGKAMGTEAAAAAAPLSSVPPAEERLKKRKRVAEQLDMENEVVKRRPAVSSSVGARVDGGPSKLSRTVLNEEDSSKSRGSAATNIEDDWDDAPASGRGGGSQAQSSTSWGQSTTTKDTGFGGNSSRFGAGRGRPRNDDNSSESSPWETSSAKPWKTRGSDDNNRRGSSFNNKSANTNNDDWGDSAAGTKKNDSGGGWGGSAGSNNNNSRVNNDDDDWGAPKSANNKSDGGWGAPAAAAASSNSKDDDDDWGIPKSSSNNKSDGGWGNLPASNSSFGDSRRDSGTSWGGGGRRDSFGDSDNRRGGRGGGSGGRGGGGGPREPRPGDWDCPSCSFRGNFSFKTECYKCQAARPEGLGTSGGDRGGRGGRGGGGGGPREPRPGDWDCPSCSFRGNFSFKTECYKCQADRPEGLGTSGGDRGGRGRGGRGGGFTRGGGDSFGGSSGNNTSSYSGWGGGTSSTTTAADDDDWGTGSSSSAPAKPAVKPLMDDNWDDDPPAAAAAPKPPQPKSAAGDDDWDDDTPAAAVPKPPPSKPATGDDNWDNDPPAAVARKPPPPKPAAGDDNWDNDLPAAVARKPPPPKAATGNDDWDDDTPAAAAPKPAAGDYNWDDETPAADAPKPSPPKPAAGDENWDNDSPPAAAPLQQPAPRSGPRADELDDGAPSFAPSSQESVAKPSSTSNGDDSGDKASVEVSKPASAPKTAAGKDELKKSNEDKERGNEDEAPAATSRAAALFSSADNERDEPNATKPTVATNDDDLWNEAVLGSDSSQTPQNLPNDIPANPRNSILNDTAARRSLTPLPDPRRSRTSSLEPTPLPDPRRSRTSSLEPTPLPDPRRSRTSSLEPAPFPDPHRSRNSSLEPAAGDIPMGEALEGEPLVVDPQQQAFQLIPVLVPEPLEILPWNIAPILGVRSRPGLLEDEAALKEFPVQDYGPSDPRAIPLEKGTLNGLPVADPRPESRPTPTLSPAVTQDPGNNPDNNDIGDQDRESDLSTAPPSSATQPPTPPNVDDDSGWE